MHCSPGRADRRDQVALDGDADHYGAYLEIDRPRRLVFLFTTAAGCEMTPTQEMQPKWAEYADRTVAGWAMILEWLGRALSG